MAITLFLRDDFFPPLQASYSLEYDACFFLWVSLLPVVDGGGLKNTISDIIKSLFKCVALPRQVLCCGAALYLL